MSCLFESLSHFINIDPNNIRQIICNYLENNGNIIEGLDTKFILSLDGNNYIENMRQSYTWGSAIEIQAACNIWNMQIDICNIRNNNNIIECIPLNKIISKKICITWNGNHFEPL